MNKNLLKTQRVLKRKLKELDILRKRLEIVENKKLNNENLQKKGYVKGRREAARYLGVSPTTVDRLRALGLKAYKKSFKSDLYFNISDLDKFFKKDIYG